MPRTKKSNVVTVEIAEGDDNQFYWHGKAANGEIVTQSEGYTRRDDANQAAAKVFPGVVIVDGEAKAEADQDQEEQAGEPAESDGDEEGQENPDEEVAGGEEEQEPGDAEEG